MSEEEKDLPQEEATETAEKTKEKEKPAWQRTKEGWYDRIPLTVKQLDIIIGLCLTGLAITFTIIILQALHIL